MHRECRERFFRHRFICFKQHFDTRHLAFCNLSPPRMFLPLDLLSEYRIQYVSIGPLYVTSSYSAWISCKGVSGFATDCPCGVCYRGLTTCLLYVGPLFGNRFKQELGCRFDMMDGKSSCFCILTYAIVNVLIHHMLFRLYLYFLVFFIFSSTPVLTVSIDVVLIFSIQRNR